MDKNEEITLKSIFGGKVARFLVLSLLFIILAVFLNQKFLHDLNDQEALSKKFQQVLHEKEKVLMHLMDEIALLEKSAKYTNIDSITGDHLFLQKGMVVFVTLNDSLVYWSDNSVPYEEEWTHEENAEEFVRLKDGWYVLESKRAGPVHIVGIILVKNEFPYQNLYLENTFQKDFDLPDEMSISSAKGPDSIYGLNGTPLFSLTLEERVPISDNQSLLLLVLCSAALLFLLSSIFLLYKKIPFLKRRKWLLLLAFATDVILIRLLIRYLEIPEFLYASKLFSPYYFATSWLAPSLGDLILNRLVLLVIGFAVFLEYSLTYRHLSSNKRLLIHFLHMVPVSVVYFLFFDSFKILVEDSSILLNLNDISAIDRYSMLGFLALTASLLSYFFLSAALLSNVWKNSVEKKEYLLVALMTIAFIFVAFGFFLNSPCQWPVCAMFVVYLLSFYYFFGKREGIHQLPAIVLFMILFAISSTFMLNHFNKLKEMENRKMLSSTLISRRDPLLEFEFMKIEARVENDSVINQYFKSPLSINEEEEEQKIVTYINDTYFNSFWNKYERLITVCDHEEVLNIQPGDYLYNCFDYFDNLIHEHGVPTGSDKLYYIDNQSENINYIAVIGSDTNIKPLIDKRIYIELYSKFVTETGLGYPELLIDKEVNLGAKISDYSYARYYDNKLIYQFGDYFYHLDFSPYARNGSDNYYINKDGYNHFVVKTDSNSWLVISRKNPAFFDIVAPFSYLFLIFSIFLLVFIVIIYLGGGYSRLEMNFRNRFQAAIITIIILSLIILGFVTRAYIIDLNNKKNVGYLTEKTYSVLVELEHKLGNYDSIPPSEESYVADLLYKFAQVFFSDINLYYTNGDLIASSRPQIFEENLLSQKMNREAFAKLAYDRSLLYIHNEEIGKQEYLSAYIPFRNYNDNIIAYLNLPYFAKQDEMREEIADFISAYINIYVLLIVLAILITILVSRYVTQPLKLIRDKMRNLAYSHSNEKIEWKREDEIGELVAEYNRTLDELARSAELLARSERESAWREMAKQVAHEIKNPLTPMKLSVQYLKKAWDDKAPDWEQRLDRFSKTIVEQIDSLSRIASEFSDFAKMPVATYEKVDLLETVHNAVDLFNDIENVKITVKSSESSCFISADRQQMLRVFNNLINNSVQAIGKKDDGRIDIRISRSGDKFMVEITDNGSGISEEQAGKIFSPSFTTKSSGMGLGLAMVKNILSGIGATISFTSEEGIGTTFLIEVQALN